MLNQFWNLACVDVNNIPRVVHYVVSENRANVVRYLGKKFPHGLLGLVLPLLVLDVVPKEICESELVGKRKVCLVKFLYGLWSCQRAIHDNGIYHLSEQSVSQKTQLWLDVWNLANGEPHQVAVLVALDEAFHLVAIAVDFICVQWILKRRFQCQEPPREIPTENCSMDEFMIRPSILVRIDEHSWVLGNVGAEDSGLPVVKSGLCWKPLAGSPFRIRNNHALPLHVRKCIYEVWLEHVIVNVFKPVQNQGLLVNEKI